jgi:hypothetical protein
MGGSTMTKAGLKNVWYLSYGSNLNRARFMQYIDGCKDQSPPQGDISLELPHSLYFARSSGRWGGMGVAFISLSLGDKPALARAYLITADQFRDVVRLENAGISVPGELGPLIDRARDLGHSRMLSRGFYPELIYCGDKSGRPILSFTASEDRGDFNRPSDNYLRVIQEGLHEAHGLSATDAVNYLKDRPGVRGALSSTDMARIFKHSCK